MEKRYINIRTRLSAGLLFAMAQGVAWGGVIASRGDGASSMMALRSVASGGAALAVAVSGYGEDAVSAF